MLNLEDDINDKELTQRWRLYWIQSIFELSNTKLQKSLWQNSVATQINEEKEYSASLKVCLSLYFDDLALYNGYDKAIEYSHVSQEESDKAQAFHQLLSFYDEPYEEEETALEDEDWPELVIRAKVLWEYIKATVHSQREQKLIEKLEDRWPD